ncbi:MAG: Gfo/Idh/MocA family oxidoreductase, partial [Polyangia bacterium]|nr:Gfo/Idh/MocA family oxidoreductase [Polyangia bacterium]
MTEPSLSPRAVGRLSVLRRVLGEMVGRAEPPEYLRSSQMAKLCGCEASLVRRDLVQVGANGRPGYGYPVRALAQRLEALFRPVAKHRVAVVGVGNLGKAIINYFQQHHQDMSVVALFDANQEKTDRVLHGIPSHRIDRFRSVSKDLGVSVAILAVPEAETQHVADIVV